MIDLPTGKRARQGKDALKQMANAPFQKILINTINNGNSVRFNNTLRKLYISCKQNPSFHGKSFHLLNWKLTLQEFTTSRENYTTGVTNNSPNTRVSPILRRRPINIDFENSR